MNKELLTAKLTAGFPGKEIKESYGFPALYIAKEELTATIQTLVEEELFGFDQLVCEAAVDRTTHLELIYHLRSSDYRNEMILKTQVEREGEPTLPSVYQFWQAAELFEDEIYDLFGIRFERHPHLRRLFLDESFEGYPLRKDFVNKEEL